MSCVAKSIQLLFFGFNFIFFSLGIAVLGVGIYSRVENDTWKELLESNSMYEAANILIAAGIIVAVIGFLGCCGAWKRITWMLSAYAILIVMIFILEIAAGIYSYVKRDTIQKSLTNKLTNGVAENYGVDNLASKGITKAINWFQKNVKCCGLSRPEDWKYSKWFEGRNDTGTVVPESCCKEAECDVSSYNSKGIFTKGCVDEGKKFAKKNLWLLGGVGVGIAVVQLLGIIFSMLLWHTYKKIEKKAEGKA